MCNARDNHRKSFLLVGFHPKKTMGKKEFAALIVSEALRMEDVLRRNSNVCWHVVDKSK